jgi:phage terminase small subunit
MPAHKKTLAEHIASGSVAKNPGRFLGRSDPPTPKAPLGKAPRHLTEQEQKVWRELSSSAPAGVLGSCDALALEIAVRLTIRMRAGKFDKTSEFTGLFNVLARLGLTPSDRNRLTGPTAAPTPEGDSELDELD